MPTSGYIILAIIFTVAALVFFTKGLAAQALADPDLIGDLIDIQVRQVHPGLRLLLRAELTFNPRYGEMQASGKSLMAIQMALVQDKNAILAQWKSYALPAQTDYERLLEERQWTAKATVAAHFQIPWSKLVEREYDLGFYITDTTTGHTYRVPFKDFRDYDQDVITIFEIDENRRPVNRHSIETDDVNDDITINHQYVTEVKKHVVTMRLL